MFPCDGYLQLAKSLATNNDESCLRSAVSRAYYASLHKSIKFAEGRGFKFSGKGKAEIHGEVVGYFKYNCGSIIFMSIGAKLGRLRKNRNDCDYEENIVNIKKLSESALLEAKEIFSGIKTA